MLPRKSMPTPTDHGRREEGGGGEEHERLCTMFYDQRFTNQILRL